MSKFKVGDVVCGLENDLYCITNENMTVGVVMECKPLLREDILVKVIEHTKHHGAIGENYTVESTFFKKIGYCDGKIEMDMSLVEVKSLIRFGERGLMTDIEILF